ncbi:MAG: hypothetical protein R3279_03895 [Putridiphycobacter sp.]|nr:hypothetical protein [Putridiphycobacter sp.]
MKTKNQWREQLNGFYACPGATKWDHENNPTKQFTLKNGVKTKNQWREQLNGFNV